VRQPIKFQCVTTQQQFDDLKKYAETDGYHKVDDSSLLPIVTMSRGDRQFGYFHVNTHPILSFAFHLELCEPADFKEAAQQVTAIYQHNSMSERFPNGTCFIALDENPKISKDLIQKLGYRCLNRVLWQNTP
jgi:hypothetical protein